MAPSTAENFSHPDWVAITLNAYQARWVQGEEADSHYDSWQRRLGEVERLSTPTLMIQGGADFCDDPKESEGLERFFTGRYERLLLEGIGHFPHRESPVQVRGSGDPSDSGRGVTDKNICDSKRSTYRS